MRMLWMQWKHHYLGTDSFVTISSSNHRPMQKVPERHWSAYDSQSHASSIWAADFQAFAFTATKKCDEIIVQRFCRKPVSWALVMPFGLCRLFGSGCLAEVFKFVFAGPVVYKQSGAKHPRAFLGQGGQKWRFDRFYKISNFHDENDLQRVRMLWRQRRQNSEIIYLR